MSNIVVITGGSSGLGLGLAEHYVAEGARVALLARNPEKLQAAAALLRAASPDAQVLALPCDVSDADATRAAFERIAVELGTPDTVVCSAGVLDEARFDETTVERMRQIMDINFFGVVQTVQAALPHLRKVERPRIAIIASVAAVMGVYGYTSYCASKHALLGFAECLRIEQQPLGIRVQIALPPEFKSPMVDPDLIERSTANIAMAKTIPPLTLEQAVEGVWAGLRGNRFVFAVGPVASTVTVMHRMFPRISRWVVDRQLRALSA